MRAPFPPTPDSPSPRWSTTPSASSSPPTASWRWCCASWSQATGSPRSTSPPTRIGCVASIWLYWTDNADVELLTGFGLATASGLNAYIPLLALGLLSRFTDLITLPHGWAWLENGWVMTIVAVLLVVEIVADKIPALDRINDIIQTFVRPTSGGIVFGSGTAAQTAAVTDPGAFVHSGQWIPIVVGVLVALVVSLTKSTVRPAANVATAGVAAPVLSTIEDGVSIAL